MKHPNQRRPNRIREHVAPPQLQAHRHTEFTRRFLPGVAVLLAAEPRSSMVHGTEQLVELIRRKHRVLGQLCEVGKRQLQLAEQGETSLLIKLLATKQSLISNLQDLERELAPFHEQDPESRMWPSPETRAQCAAQAAECNDLLREIVAMEQSGVEKMTSRRDAIAAQLQQLGTARQVCSAYESQRRRPQGNTLPGAIVGTTRQQ